MPTSLRAIILAAGKSKRFNTGNSKLLEPLCGQELILYPVKILHALGIPTTLVTGYKKDEIKACIDRHNIPVTFIEQKNQSGTGDAFLCSQSTWDAENILVINGDAPLITESIIKNLIEKHNQSHAAISFVTAHNSDPLSRSYGRIIRSGKCLRVVEARELSPEAIADHCCVNAGIYLIKRSYAQSMNNLQPNETTGEIHITDLINNAAEKELIIETTIESFDHIRGVNDMQELWAAEQIKRSELIRYWMSQGVRFAAAQNVDIDINVRIGAGTFIGCGVHLLGNTTVGKHCMIYAFSWLENSSIANQTTIYPHSVIQNSIVGNNAEIGPFARLRNDTIIHDGVHIGNFVETKATTVGEHSRVKHLTYLGDASIGKNVNIGAGTITCNFDGLKKHKTLIADNVFIGSNTSIVAPARIDKNAYTGAGSVITEDVPAGSLAIGRARQINKENYAQRCKAKHMPTLRTSNEPEPAL